MKQLNRELSFSHALSLVVGTIIGTGIFIKTGVMTQQLGSPSLVLLAWTVAGLVSLLGALAYGELAALFPEAGGEYVFLKNAYGRLFAFFFGWTRFLIAGPGSIAAYAVGATAFLAPHLHFLPSEYRAWFAMALIALFSLINSFRVKRGGDAQNLLTFIKFALLFGLIFGALLLSEKPIMSENSPFTVKAGGFSFSLFSGAVVSALWAYDGWNNLVMAAGEIQNPKKNLPLALVLGFCLVLIIYLLVNFSYFSSLSLEQILSSYSTIHPEGESVGLKAYETFLGVQAKGITSFALALSALGAMNGSILTGSRVPYAMAADGVFFPLFSKLSEKGSVPLVSVWSQGILASLFALTGSFDQITDMVVFSSWIFYGACVATLFRFRKKAEMQKQNYTGYRMPGYPVLPALFVLIAVVLLLTTWIQSFKESTIGLLLILAGAPIYFYYFKKNLFKRDH